MNSISTKSRRQNFSVCGFFLYICNEIQYPRAVALKSNEQEESSPPDSMLIVLVLCLFEITISKINLLPHFPAKEGAFFLSFIPIIALPIFV